jgi:hypothetical protein
MRTAALAGCGPREQKEAMRRAMRAIADMDFDAPPAVIATRAIRAADGVYRSVDPFERLKVATTDEALELFETIRRDVDRTMAGLDEVGRVRYSAKLSAAGNIIDFGVQDDFDLEGTLRETLATDLAADASEELYRALVSAGAVLLIGDNAGEIVFDRFLLDEALRLGTGVYLAVKSGGILNDATMEDARRAGIDSRVRILETGSASLGVDLTECSPEFIDLYRRSDVVISKGQANYETLDDADRDIFFILRAKCPIIAAGMGVPDGASVLIHHGQDYI